MSSMEAKYVRLIKADSSTVSMYLNDVVGMDEYELSDYMGANNLIMLNGSLWVYDLREELDPRGFTHVLQDDDGVKEVIALWYNGGAGLEEIIEWAFKE